MSDSGLFNSGLRRKRKPRERPPFRDREYNKESFGGRPEFRRSAHDYQQTDDKSTPKLPVILAKPDSGDVLKHEPSILPSTNNENEKVNLKARGHVHDIGSPSYNSSTRLLNVQSGSIQEKSEIYKGKRTGSTSSLKKGAGQTNSDSPSGSLTEKSDAQKIVKILDGFLYWTDSGIELLEDQTDFLVVGVLGLQGVGKSTIMSYLAGSDILLKPKKLIFPCQTQDVMERASNTTIGVDMYVTEERVIFLDAQPILSPSLLEQCIYNDRKMSAEYNGPSVGIEMQSLQIATFFYSVCHAVIVVQDWFTDSNLYRFLLSAEMLKMSTPAHSADSTNAENEFDEFHPHLIFVHNKVEDTLLHPSYIITMTETISHLFQNSKLLYNGSISLSKSMLFSNLMACIPQCSEINLFLIPKLSMEQSSNHGKESSEDNHFERLPQYCGHPNDEKMLKTFKNMIFSLRRLQLTRQTLTEKTWFYYAAKTWDAIKKSQLMSEYNRLLV